MEAAGRTVAGICNAHAPAGAVERSAAQLLPATRTVTESAGERAVRLAARVKMLGSEQVASRWRSMENIQTIDQTTTE